MRVRLLPTLALCSLACSVALAGLLALSYVSPVVVYLNPAGGSHYVAAKGGTILLSTGTADSVGSLLVAGAWDPNDGPWGGGILSFGWVYEWAGRHSRRTAWFPLWLPIVVTAVPTWRALRRRRRGVRGFEVGTTGQLGPGRWPSPGCTVRDDPSRGTAPPVGHVRAGRHDRGQEPA